MGPSTKTAGPEGALSRRNTFQRMLDLERKNKVNRMQALSSSTTSIPLARASTSMSLGQSQDSISTPNLEARPPTSLASTGRAMTTPALSVSIPSGNSSSSKSTTKKYVIGHNGQIIPQEDEAAEESDASSICQSPGWDDLSGKKRKKEKKEKEKKRKEKEKAEIEAMKQAEKLKKRLTKTPGKRLSKMPDRSTSEPAVMQTLREATRPPITEQKTPSDTRSRRGSVEISLKTFMHATQAIPVPWRNSHASPTSSPSVTPEPSTRSFSRATSITGSGFIGGLKLRQAEESTVQETIRVRVTENKEEAAALLNTGSDDLEPPKTLGNTSSGSSIAESIRPHTPTFEDSMRTPQQWDSIYAQAAKIATGHDLPKQIEDPTPIMERNIRKAKKQYPPTSRYFSAEDEEFRLRDSSTASARHSIISGSHSGGDSSHDRRPSTAFSGEQTSRVASPNRGRPSSSYVRNSRRQSEDRSLYGFQDELQVLEATISNGSGSGSQDRSSTFFRNPKSSRDQSVELPDNSQSSKENITATVKTAEPIHSLNELYTPPSLPLSSPTLSTFSSHERKPSGFKGIKIAAKAAFSRQSTSTDTTKQVRPPTPGRTGAPPRPDIGPRAFTTGVLASNSPLTKIERILDERSLETSPTGIINDFAPPPPRSADRPNSSGRQSARRRHRSPERSRERNTDIPPVPSRPSHSHSRSSSEDAYDTCNESSNITTPTLSRPHSRKDHVISVEQTKTAAARSKSMVMSGGIHYDDTQSGHEGWSRTAMPLELTEDEDNEKTPTRIRTPAGKSQTDLHKPVLEKPTVSNAVTKDSDLNRKPSISRSISTPELTDLSFLPPLKHQALTRPKGKGKGLFSKKTKHVSIVAAPTNKEKALIRPPPIPVPTTKSEGNSPTSPTSSNYLQTARLNLPHQGIPRSPKFPSTHNSNSLGNGPDPIAKMFVICCSCKYFHDMPSKIYECMAKPDSLVEDRERKVSGVISTSVKCPWCGHGMSTSCCAGYAAVVYLRERLH